MMPTGSKRVSRVCLQIMYLIDYSEKRSVMGQKEGSMEKEITVAEAMEVIKKAMADDSPAEQGSYAHSWHCNIAMMCYDAIIDELGDSVPFDALKIANNGASRFMKLCFGVETKQ